VITKNIRSSFVVIGLSATIAAGDWTDCPLEGYSYGTAGDRWNRCAKAEVNSSCYF